MKLKVSQLIILVLGFDLHLFFFPFSLKDPSLQLKWFFISHLFLNVVCHQVDFII